MSTVKHFAWKWKLIDHIKRTFWTKRSKLNHQNVYGGYLIFFNIYWYFHSWKTFKSVFFLYLKNIKLKAAYLLFWSTFHEVNMYSHIHVVIKYIIECISGTVLGAGDTNSSWDHRVPLFMEQLERAET